MLLPLAAYGARVRELPVPSGPTCEVFWVRLDQFAPSVWSRLSSQEKQRAQAFKREADRRRSALGAGLLRAAAAQRWDTAEADVVVDRRCDRCGAQHGRPRLQGGEHQLHASITHSGGLVGVAVSDVPVGLDVELVQDIEVELLWRELRGPVGPAPTVQAVLTDWVRKEAVVKATGEGLSRPLIEVEVTPPWAAPRLLSYGQRALSALIRDLHPAADHVAAIALMTSSEVALRQTLVRPEPCGLIETRGRGSSMPASPGWRGEAGARLVSLAGRPRLPLS